ncbi:MAG: undecaprenyl-diphosphate phosphatase, partial [Candidatus Izemoplasmatales bacterium]
MTIILEFIRYIVLGIIQGIFEVLPISSSAQVAFLQEMFKLEVDTSGLFAIILNFGSMIALIYFFRKEIKILIIDTFKYLFKKDQEESVKENFNYVFKLVIGIIPLVIFGYFLNLLIMPNYEKNPFIFMGVGALMTATILYLVRNITNYHVQTKLTNADAFVIGLIQVITIMPGLSRLGTTTAVGLKRKLSMDSALKFSFLMLIPISLGAVFQQFLLYEFNPELITQGFD